MGSRPDARAAAVADEIAPRTVIVRDHVDRLLLPLLRKIDGEFGDKAAAVDFLQAYQTGNWTPCVNIHDGDIK